MLDLPSDIYYVATEDFEDEEYLFLWAILIIGFNILLAIVLAGIFGENLLSILTRYKELLFALNPDRYEDSGEKTDRTMIVALEMFFEAAP